MLFIVFALFSSILFSVKMSKRVWKKTDYECVKSIGHRFLSKKIKIQILKIYIHSQKNI